MKQHTLHSIAFVLLACGLALLPFGCQQEALPDGPTITQYYVTATIGETAFEATHTVVASVNDSTLNIRGSAGVGFPNLALSLEEPTLGSIIIGGNTASQITWTASDANDVNVVYRAALGSGSGTVVLSRFDQKVEGTFTAIAFNDRGDSVKITDGTFYAHLQPD